ncbi:MAG TPA: glycosyltransferase N-terminal domain-containing protein [Caulobacteraceae bacterium]
MHAPAVQWLMAVLVWAYFEMVIATMRWRLVDADAARVALESPQGLLALFWHGRLTQAIACRPLLGKKSRRVIISLSRDGEFIARAAERLGIPTIRGSAGRPDRALAKRGASAYRQAVRFIAGGGAALMTPDGPRGPAETLPPGPVQIARAAASPVVLMGLAADPTIKIASWDGARIPLPFSRGCLVVDGPHGVGETPLEAVRADWQARMTVAQARAEAILMPGKHPLSLDLYRTLAGAASVAAPVVLRARAGRGKEDIARLGERLGVAGRPRPPGELLWLHAASVGESLSLLPLIEALAEDRPGVAILVTSGTRTSAELLSRRLPQRAIHQYAPIDAPRAVARFLDHWRPRLGIFVESELWPNLILTAHARGAKLALVSARFSPSSLRGWRMAPGLFRATLGAFERVLARDEDAAARITALGARVDGCVDMKFGARPLPVDEAALSLMSASLTGRPVIFAASTHRGEDAPLIERFAAVRAACKARPLLVIAPRHPERGAEVGSLASAAGLTAGLASRLADAAGADVFIADTLGDLGLWYRLSRIAFIGGSLVGGVGGHNPLEAARLDCPFVSGPHFDNWPVYAELENLGATRIVATAHDLERPFASALSGADDLALMAKNARQFVEVRDGEVRAMTRGLFALLDS